jgi:hypothetical protein
MVEYDKSCRTSLTAFFQRDKIDLYFLIMLSATDGIVEHHMEQRAKLPTVWAHLDFTTKCALFEYV